MVWYGMEKFTHSQRDTGKERGRLGEREREREREKRRGILHDAECENENEKELVTDRHADRQS